MKTNFNTKIILVGIILLGGIMITSIFGFGALSSYRKINEEKTYAMEGINEIQVNLTSIPVHIIRSDTANDVNIYLYGEARREIKLISEIRKGTVVVGVKREFAILPIPEDMILDIYIPGEYGKSLSIKTSSGIVKMDSLDLTNFFLDTTSGGLKADHIAAEKISITTSSGNLNIKKFDTKELKIKGSSANINIDEGNVEEALMRVSSGNIVLKNYNGSIDLNVTSGDTLISFREFEDQKVNVQATSGNIALELPGTAEFFLKTETTSGKTQSDFPINPAGNTAKNKIEGQVGTGNNQVSLKASSGNIKITKKGFTP